MQIRHGLSSLVDIVNRGRRSHGHVTALLLALAHGAVDLALAGHLSPEGKGHASPDDLVDDLFRHLAAAA